MSFQSLINKIKLYHKKIKLVDAHSQAYFNLIGFSKSVEGILILLIGFFLYANTDLDRLVMSVLIICSFISFTYTFNDVHDIEIDRINKKDKPLVTGVFSVGFARLIAGYFFIITLIFGLATKDIVYVVFSVLLLSLGFVYSYPPLSFSKKTLLTLPTMLAGYVLIPFYMGVYSASGLFPSLTDHLIIVGLMLMLASRIILKDIRDRKGDKAHGRRTLALSLENKYVFLLSLGLVMCGALITYLSLREILQNSYIFLLLSAIYVAFMLLTLIQISYVNIDLFNKKINSSLIKIYFASRLYLIIIILFLYIRLGLI
jgi:4-hydroxybenzoate polyprenyltransferase